MTKLPSTQATIRLFLSSLVFRFNHVLAGADEAFGEFSAGEDVRTPREIVRHMSGLLGFVRAQLGGAAGERLEPLTWRGELERFSALARTVDAQLALSAEPQGELNLAQLWQGPLTDALTHVGQLATLRRLSGSPVARVRYWQVEMPPLNE